MFLFYLLTILSIVLPSSSVYLSVATLEIHPVLSHQQPSAETCNLLVSSISRRRDLSCPPESTGRHTLQRCLSPSQSPTLLGHRLSPPARGAPWRCLGDLSGQVGCSFGGGSPTQPTSPPLSSA